MFNGCIACVAVVHLVTTIRSAHLAIMFGVASQPSVSTGEFKGFTVRMDPDFDEDMEQWTLLQDKTVNLGTQRADIAI